jgi:Mn2+/Fe2+ NRAMP family transporter
VPVSSPPPPPASDAGAAARPRRHGGFLRRLGPGLVTGEGIVEVLRRHQPAWVLRAAVALLLSANLFNLGADLGAMAAALGLLVGGGPAPLYAVASGALCVALPAWMSFRRYAAVLKWLTLSLLAYVAALAVVRVPWGEALRGALLPSLPGGMEGPTALVAVLGTTISPYLFFWQSSQEAEEHRARADGPGPLPPARLAGELRRVHIDTVAGMAASNLVALCIIITAAATLHAAGVTRIATAAQAAEALRPIAGPFAGALFAAGVVGTVLLAAPTLAGSAAYALAEAFGWRTGLDRAPHEARAFYGALAGATAVGVGLGFVGLDPVRALYWSAVLNGLLAPPLMALIMRTASDPRAMRGKTLPPWLRAAGWAAMAAAAAALVASWLL